MGIPEWLGWSELDNNEAKYWKEHPEKLARHQRNVRFAIWFIWFWVLIIIGVALAELFAGGSHILFFAVLAIWPLSSVVYLMRCKKLIRHSTRSFSNITISQKARYK
ncbi:MAG: hypothetical protein QXN16_02240 [Candidatus Micrarchaeaceae archaeon]